tara:strand:+ start:236 stop:874 length:639 start_codon:yes stop_codon:yes gene_type:complete
VTQNTDQRGGRAILLLIAGLPVTMILAATWLWYFVERGDIDIVGALGTANSGVILSEPANIKSRAFTATDGTDTSLDQLEPKWTFMIVQQGDVCDVQCNELLYLTRQIRIAIGRDFNRIQRVLIVDTPAAQMVSTEDSSEASSPLLAALDKEHSDLQVWLADGQPVIPERHVDGFAWYLVDPSGWVMMRYAAQVNYKDVISDLKFLLKNAGG